MYHGQSNRAENNQAPPHNARMTIRKHLKLFYRGSNESRLKDYLILE